MNAREVFKQRLRVYAKDGEAQEWTDAALAEWPT